MHALKPLSIVMNMHSGHHKHEIDLEQISSVFKNAGFIVQIFFTTEQHSLDWCVKQAIQRHIQYPWNEQGMIVAAGGDGTVNTLAQGLIETNIQLGILPLGTFNYVARALNIPLNIEQAVQNMVEGNLRKIHVGSVNQRIYLNNASIGLYPMIIESREYYNRRFGRFPAVAYFSGLGVLLKPHRHYRLQIKIDGEHLPLDTPMVFFGNNQLQLQDLNLRLATCAKAGKLAGVAIKKVNHWKLLQLAIKLFQGSLEQATDVYSFCAEHVEILSKMAKMKVALDGEIVELTTPLQFSVKHNAIQVRVPNVIASL